MFTGNKGVKSDFSDEQECGMEEMKELSLTNFRRIHHCAKDPLESPSFISFHLKVRLRY